MFGLYDVAYGSQHTVDGYSSQPIVGGSSSLVRHFSLKDMKQMYSPQFSESCLEEESLVKEVEEIQVQTPNKNTNRRRQPAPTEKTNRKARNHVVFHTLKEVALCRSRVRIFEDSVAGNPRKTKGEAIDKEYLQRTETKYQAEYGVPFTLLHLSKVLKMCDKCSVEVPEFIAQREEHKSKRYKSSDDSLFNTRKSGKGSFNLNNTVRDEEEEVLEFRPSRPHGQGPSKEERESGDVVDIFNN
ncbi:hypothetical protein Tco_0609088 [Tanacetum coccineum]